MIKDPMKRFGYRGVYYSNQDDFLKAVVGFNSSPITDASVDELLSQLGADIKINITLSLSRLTNEKLRTILHKVFEEMFKEGEDE